MTPTQSGAIQLAFMNPSVSIAKIEVNGLHNQFDVDLTLLPGLNVIYGKNGRGKTTLLHLLANVLELDFSRFAHIEFQRIFVQTSNGHSIELLKDESAKVPRVSLDGSQTSYNADNESLSEAEQTTIRHLLGARAIYLPAFRSILERTRTDTPAYIRQGNRSQAEIEEISKREQASLIADISGRAKLNPAWYVRQMQEKANAIAEKTLLCRQWFGQFVPVIRYPSVRDVEESLTEEWRQAVLEISSREQHMFESTFFEIFKLIANNQQSSPGETDEDLLASIDRLLEDPNAQIGAGQTGGRYDLLLRGALPLGSGAVPLSAMQKSVASVYRRVLTERKQQRERAFQKCRDFENSINRFLDNKRLCFATGLVSRNQTSVNISSEGGHSYGLFGLSSGERQILTMLYSASRALDSDGIFLIDEPEISLHIDWQRIILSELTRLSPQRQFIACTHSPEVGADHFEQLQTFNPRAAARPRPTEFVIDES